MPAGLENELFQLRVDGFLPVMAHPERYVAVQRDSAGGAARATRGDDDRSGRARRRARARRDEDRAQAGAGGARARRRVGHPSPRGAKGIAAGMAWIRKQLGQRGAEQMLADNTRRLLAGEMPDAPAN